MKTNTKKDLAKTPKHNTLNGVKPTPEIALKFSSPNTTTMFYTEYVEHQFSKIVAQKLTDRGIKFTTKDHKKYVAFTIYPAHDFFSDDLYELLELCENTNTI